VEAAMIITATIAEIPTGAIADLLGKKKTLTAAFIFMGVGGYLMARATGLTDLVTSVIVITIGGALYSGTLEALLFETLKGLKQEQRYSRSLAHTNSAKYIAIAIASIIGGFLYTTNPRFPFFFTSLAGFLGAFLTFFLKEPLIDTEKFSFRAYIRQTTQGFRQLFLNVAIKKITMILLSVGIFLVILWEMLNDALGVSSGLTPEQLGIFFTAVYLVSAVSSYFFGKFSNKLQNLMMFLLVGLFVAATLIISPILGLTGIITMVALRSFTFPLFNITISTNLNQHIESRYRATTLSTFTMIQNLPYVLSAFFIGRLIDILSVKTFSFWLGIIMIVVVGVQFLQLVQTRYRNAH
jgi:MFS family permease